MPKTTTAPNPTSSSHLDELAHILALGILRLRRRREANNSNGLRDIPVDFSPDRSGHAVPKKRMGRPR